MVGDGCWVVCVMVELGGAARVMGLWVPYDFFFFLGFWLIFKMRRTIKKRIARNRKALIPNLM